MNKKVIKEVVIMGILMIFALMMPFFVFMILPPLMLSLWLTGVILLVMAKRKNPQIEGDKRYQIFEKLLYFQIINWAFAYFIFIPVLNLMALVILIVLVVLSFNKERRTNAIYIKWVKYVCFHLFNLAFVLVLLNNFPSIGEAAFAIIPLLTFINGITAAAYLSMINKLPAGRIRIFVLIIFLVMMAGTVLSLFPQESGIPVIDTIFGGGS